MNHLSELLLDGTSITEVPSSIELLTGLQLLNLGNYNNLVRLPNCLNGLKSLKTLNLSGCSKLQNVPETLGLVESLEELDISRTAIRQPESSIFLMKNLKLLSFRGCNGELSSTSWYRRFLMQRSSDVGALRLPSLSGLFSLRELNLSDCNIGEGDIPSDIGNLHSLEELFLGKNDFITLPASINGLLKLKYLELDGCKRLQSLPQLPPHVRGVSMNGCLSLVTLSGALKLCKSENTSIHCVYSSKSLGNNDLAISMLREYLEAFSPLPRVQELFNSVFPEREIPKFQEFSIVVPGSEIPKWFMYQNEGSPNHVELLFEPFLCHGLEVKRCGFHPVYMHEVEEFDQTENQWSRFTAYNLNEFHHDFVGSNTEVATPQKRSHAEYVGAAEASGSGCCDDDDEEQLERRAKRSEYYFLRINV